jgi:hypothetical protein
MIALGASSAFAQSSIPAIQDRIAQQVVISNQRVDAAFVLTPGGGIQSYTCPSPQQYVTPDGASQGWACFDPATGVWLLAALPPQQQVPAPAPVVVQQAAAPPVVYSYPVVQPAVIYRQPAVVYAAPVYPATVVVERVYSPSAAIAAAAINAGGRIAAAVIESSRIHDHREIRIIQGPHRR